MKSITVLSHTDSGLDPNPPLPLKVQNFSPCTSMNSKWIKNLDIRPETLKLMQERTGNML
jgi:hypothetical protein